MELDDEAAVVDHLDLSRLVARMSLQASSKKKDWENETLPDFLEAMAAWLRDMDGYFRNQGMEAPAQPTWALIAEMLQAATLYE